MGGSSSFEVNPLADPVDAAAMSGVWYVIHTNLAVWKSRICPVVIYEPMQPTEKQIAQAKAKGGQPPNQVKDITEFRTGTLEKQSKECSYYLGVDTQMPGGNGSIWKWHGSGMLGMLSCDWQMQKHDADYRWAIVTFEGTAFSKAGFDIYSRTPSLSDELLAEIEVIIGNDPYLKSRYVNMFKAVQDPRGRNRPGSKMHIEPQPQA